MVNLGLLFITQLQVGAIALLQFLKINGHMLQQHGLMTGLMENLHST